MYLRLAAALLVLIAWTRAGIADEICTVIADVKTGGIVYREGPCERRAPPQSSFKLPLALMGFDSGILSDAHTPRWEYRKEFGGSREVEKRAHDPASWEADSVVWFSQELTRKLGTEKFAAYVEAFGYGNRDVSGDPGKDNGLTRAWLSSSLQISADEQIAFLMRLRARTLPVSDHAFAMTDAIMPSFDVGGWKVQGKTGSGWLRGADGGLDRSRPVGWFGGWARRNGREIVFTRLFLGDRKRQEYGGMLARDGLLADLPALADRP